MTSLTRTTKLLAINTMLTTIGESQTNTLTGTLPWEVDLAVSILDETVRELCLSKYVFNFEKEISIIPDGSNRLLAASNYIQMEPADTGDTNEYVLRPITSGSTTFMVYDITNKTSSFTSTKSFNVTYLLDYEELPEAAKRFVTIRAARVYADRLMASAEVRAFTQVDEIEAKAKLEEYAYGVDRNNMLIDSPDTYNFLNRWPR
jgi:hypothetical protein